MTTREYLETIRQLERRIRSLEYRLETCCEHAGVRSSALTSMPRAQGPARSHMEEAVTRALDLSAELDTARQQLLCKQLFLEDLAIFNADSPAAEMFLAHYLKHESMRILGKQFCLSESHIGDLIAKVRAKLDGEFAKQGDVP